MARGRLGDLLIRLEVFGTCRRCTRLSGSVALGLIVVAVLGSAALGPSSLATIATLVAAMLAAALYLAHRIAAGRRRRPVIHLLKVFGAEAREARAIVGAFPSTADLAELRAGRLRPGETLDVMRDATPAGTRISRVVVRSGSEVLAAVARRDDGRFGPVDVATDSP